MWLVSCRPIRLLETGLVFFGFFCEILLKNCRTKTWLNSFKMETPSYRNQSIDLLCKSMNWFLYDRGLHLERVNSDIS